MVPTHLLSDFAEVCGIHAGDGWMSSYNNEVGYGTAVYEKDYFVFVLNLYSKIFPMQYIRLLWRNALELRFQSRASQKMLMDVGFPRGPKLDGLFIPAFV
ncbi:MAG TPA: hypothetical protein VLJ21_02200, partial [Candidatus Binatia bacterium]|nr:hypothetical protein [Candidatus Binatia bacterium]